jgi:hypothetical protein
MKMKWVIYLMMIFTGILIYNFGLKTNVIYEKLFAEFFAGLGAFNIILDIIKKKKNEKKKI